MIPYNNALNNAFMTYNKQVFSEFFKDFGHVNVNMN